MPQGTDSWDHPYGGGSAAALRGKTLRIRDPWVPLHLIRPAFLSAVGVRGVLSSGPAEVLLDKGGVTLREREIEPEGNGWLYDILWAGFREASDHLGIKVTGIYQKALLLDYDANDAAQSPWHTDYTEMDRSKIAVSVGLNEGYEGGELELIGMEESVSLGTGDAVFFAGFLGHRVVPLTKGNRKVLVAWAGGPALR